MTHLLFTIHKTEEMRTEKLAYNQVSLFVYLYESSFFLTRSNLLVFSKLYSSSSGSNGGSSSVNCSHEWEIIIIIIIIIRLPFFSNYHQSGIQSIRYSQGRALSLRVETVLHSLCYVKTDRWTSIIQSVRVWSENEFDDLLLLLLLIELFFFYLYLSLLFFTSNAILASRFESTLALYLTELL